MAAAAADKALANSGLTAADIDLVVVATCTSVDRCPNVASRVAAKLGIAAPGRVRPQHRLLRLLVRAGHRRPRDPGRRRPQRAGDRRREALRLHRLDRPLHLHHLRRRRRRRRGHRRRRGRAAGIGPVRLGLGAGQGRRGPHRGLAPVHPAGGPDGLPLGHHRARARSPCRPASGPASTRRSSPRSCRTRPTPGSSTASPSGSACPNAVIAKDIVESGNTSAASVPLALSKLVERREVPSGAPVLLFGFGGGLTYAGQVVRCP